MAVGPPPSQWPVSGWCTCRLLVCRFPEPLMASLLAGSLAKGANCAFRTFPHAHTLETPTSMRTHARTLSRTHYSTCTHTLSHTCTRTYRVLQGLFQLAASGWQHAGGRTSFYSVLAPPSSCPGTCYLCAWHAPPCSISVHAPDPFAAWHMLPNLTCMVGWRLDIQGTTLPCCCPGFETTASQKHGYGPFGGAFCCKPSSTCLSLP